MQIRWREHRDTAVMVILVIPREKISTVISSVNDRAESIREIRAILQSFEICFGKGIIIAVKRQPKVATFANEKLPGPLT